MKLVSLVLSQIIYAVLSIEENDHTQVLVNLTSSRREHLNIPPATRQLIFLNFNGTVYEDTLSQLNNLESITFQDAHFDAIEPGALCSSPKINSITLNSVDIPKLKAEHFQDCQNLRNLEIRYHDFPIEPHAFENLENLETLLTAQFNWNKLQARYFTGLDKVKKISITTANIDGIEPGSFEELGNLEELILSNNEIANITGNEFRGLSNLRFLNLDSNPTISVNVDKLLENAPKLKQLYVSYALLTDEDKEIIHRKLKVADVSVQEE